MISNIHVMNMPLALGGLKSTGQSYPTRVKRSCCSRLMRTGLNNLVHTLQTWLLLTLFIPAFINREQLGRFNSISIKQCVLTILFTLVDIVETESGVTILYNVDDNYE